MWAPFPTTGVCLSSSECVYPSAPTGDAEDHPEFGSAYAIVFSTECHRMCLILLLPSEILPLSNQDKDVVK